MRIQADILRLPAALAAAALLLLAGALPPRAQADGAAQDSPAPAAGNKGAHPSDHQSGQESGNESGRDVGEELDRVIAVVNNQVILASDVDMDMRIYRMLPIGERTDFTRGKALERLTTRALIEQQIVQQDPHGLEVSPEDLAASLAELRQNLPGCKTHDCSTPAGWAAYLAAFGITPERLSEYWSQRMAVLRFIELRFRSGIRITPDEIQTYYWETLVPLYEKRADAPPLDKLSARIQEILLQERVNALLGDWLKSLQEQGQVEILDPELRAQAAAANLPSAETGGKP